ncbi:MAG: 3D domain-containing protein [Clostridia bacterium]|nr:3D domain-containing protein [Clostridia bacterium]
MSFYGKKSKRTIQKKIDDALMATKEFVVKYSRPICAVLLAFVTVLTLSYFGVTVRRFNIFDGKTTKTVTLLNGDVNKALLKVNITDGFEIISTEKQGSTTNVSIEYTFPVTIEMGKNRLVVDTTSATVKEIIDFAGIYMDGDDEIEPSLDTVIDKASTIKYYDVEYVTGSYNEIIPHSTKTVYSSSLSKGKTTTVKGADGKQKVTYTQKRINGEVVETFVNNKQILTTAVDGKNIIGTAAKKSQAVITSSAVKCISTLKPAKPIALDAKGVPVNYKKSMTVQATAYTYTGHRCATGVTPQPGYIAVNPKIIPYGTKLYIKSSDGRFIYGYAVAADTGGFVRTRPTNVDLFFATRSECRSFGRRNVQIYILE